MADPHTPARARRLSLVIPAYNEEAAIRQAVAEADNALSRLAVEYEVLVVDDGSEDDTAAAVLAESFDRPRVRLLRHETNRGYGAALRTGFEAARFERVAFTDADCQFHLDDLAVLLPLTDTHPIAVGYRAERQDTPWRCFLSHSYNWLVRGLCGTRVRDCDCALKVFRREALAHLLPESSGFFVNAEMLARARRLGYPVVEAGVRHRPRESGRSSVSFREVPRVLATLLPFWWTRVLFPAADGDNRDGISLHLSLKAGVALLGLALLAVVLFLGRLGCALQEPGEVRFAEGARQMLAAGPWQTDAPPLSSWLVLLSYRTLGVHDWAARLVQGSIGLLVVLLTYLWGRHAAGPRAALLGALALCLSVPFVFLGRLLGPDALLTACVVAGLAAGYTALRAPRLRVSWWLLSAFACGLGVLAGGPWALALVVVPLLIAQALDRRWMRPAWRAWALYLATTAVVAAPCFAVGVASPAASASWSHAPVLLLGLLPWGVLAPGFVRYLGGHSARSAARRPGALGLFLLAALVALAMFAMSGGRATALLPALPPLALALGCYLDAVLDRWLAARRGSAMARRGAAPGFRAAQVILGAAAGMCLLAVALERAAPVEGVAWALAAGLVLWLVSRSGWDQRPAAAWGLCAGVALVLVLVGVHGLLPDYARRSSLRGQVRRLAEQGLPVACYPQRWDSISFYLQRNDIRTYGPDELPRLFEALRQEPETLIFVQSGEPLRELLADLPPGLEFLPRGRQGALAVGTVRPRQEAPLGLYATHE